MARHNSTINRITIRTERGQVSGYVEGRTFYRTIDDNQILRTPPALAIDARILEQLQALQVERLVFRHRKAGTTYRSTLAHFLAKSFEMNRGYGRQRALPLNGWTKETPGRPSQSTLWGGQSR